MTGTILELKELDVHYGPIQALEKSLDAYRRG